MRKTKNSWLFPTEPLHTATQPQAPTMNYTIRNAVEGDIPAMVDLLIQLFSIEADFQPDNAKQRRGLSLMLDEPDVRPIWVAEINGEVVGMCTCQVLVSTAQGSRVGLIEDVIIQPEYRGAGIGKALLNAVADWATEQKLTRLQLLCDTANESGLAFYASQKWQSTQLTCLMKMLGGGK